MERVINIPFECLRAEKSFCGWWMAWQNRVTPSPSPLRFRIKIGVGLWENSPIDGKGAASLNIQK